MNTLQRWAYETRVLAGILMEPTWYAINKPEKVLFTQKPHVSIASCSIDSIDRTGCWDADEVCALQPHSDVIRTLHDVTQINSSVAEMDFALNQLRKPLRRMEIIEAMRNAVLHSESDDDLLEELHCVIDKHDPCNRQMN